MPSMLAHPTLVTATQSNCCCHTVSISRTSSALAMLESAVLVVHCGIDVHEGGIGRGPSHHEVCFYGLPGPGASYPPLHLVCYLLGGHVRGRRRHSAQRVDAVAVAGAAPARAAAVHTEVAEVQAAVVAATVAAAVIAAGSAGVVAAVGGGCHS